jgi:hypothetical protein
MRAEAAAVVRPGLLTEEGVAALVRGVLGAESSDELCSSFRSVSGGNPFYLHELLRRGQPEGLELAPRSGAGVSLVDRVASRVRRLDPDALRLAQALAVLGDGCELRRAAVVARLDLAASIRLAAGLVRVEVLESTEPVRFLHPVVRSAVEASLTADALDVCHRAAARVLHDDGLPPGRVAAHLVRVLPAGDPRVLARLR